MARKKSVGYCSLATNYARKTGLAESRGTRTTNRHTCMFLRAGYGSNYKMVLSMEIFSYQECKQRNPNGPRSNHLGRRFSLLPSTTQGSRDKEREMANPNLGQLRGVGTQPC